MTADSNNGPRATFFVPNCKTLRISAHMTLNKLAQQCGVDRASLAKIEKHHGVTEIVATKVFDTLNELHGGELKRAVELLHQP